MHYGESIHCSFLLMKIKYKVLHDKSWYHQSDSDLIESKIFTLKAIPRVQHDIARCRVVPVGGLHHIVPSLQTEAVSCAHSRSTIYTACT